MPDEAQVRAVLIQNDQVATAHPTWGAFALFAVGSQALYDNSRRTWRSQSPAISVEAQEGAYGFDVAPGLPSIR